MASGGFVFGPFRLDPDDRLLQRDGTPVELNSRYFDALVLLVREQGKLVSKERFLEEVWEGTPVTDEALTQCIRTLRRQLGDSAGRPSFIETAPKHGYRFIADAAWVEGETVRVDAPKAEEADPWREVVTTGIAGAIGGAAAGVVGGLFYGALGGGAGMGAASALVVMLAVNVIVGVLGGAGVGLGIGAGRRMGADDWRLNVVGGAVGGAFIGALANLVGMDAFNLLFGAAPEAITGAPEGAVLGAAAGLAAWLAQRGAAAGRLRVNVAIAAAVGAAAGGLIVALGGRLMGGSLAALAGRFEGSRLPVDGIGRLFGEDGFGTISLYVTSALEGALFVACLSAALVLMQRLGNRR